MSDVRAGVRNPFVPIAFVDSLGSAALLAAGVLIYTKLLGLSTGAIGTGLAIAAMVAIVLVLPVSHWVERFSPRTAMTTTNLILAVLVLLLLAPFGPVWFSAVIAAITLGQRCLSAVRGAALGRLPGDRITARARTRAAQNLGLTVGGAAAAAVVAVGSHPALAWLLVADAVSYLVCGFMALRLPRTARRAPSTASPFAIARDRPFLLACVLNTFAALHQSLLFVALPLWIVHNLHAAPALVPITAVLNTVLVVALQTRLARQAHQVDQSLRIQAGAALILLLGCAAAAATAAPAATTWAQVVLLLLAATGFTLSEIVQSAAAWGIAYGLAPEESLTQYQALFGLSNTAEDVIGPILSTFVVLTLPDGLGWIAAGALVLATSTTGWLTHRRWISPSVQPARS